MVTLPKQALASVVVVTVVVLVGAACSGSGSRRGSAATNESGDVASAAASMVEWPVTRCGTLTGKGCAPTSARVDVERPTFSHPTTITNPLFPISALDSVVLLGTVDGKRFRSETTLIPGPHSVTVDGEAIPVVVSQYTAYLDGRIDEVAVDRYAQADDGSVWYLGEDVFDYRNGGIAITEGSWLAGRDGPPAMIMPAHPKVGDVFRSENITGVVFEEIMVKAVDQTVAGPTGSVRGAAIMQELHLDGAVSDKVFAPGYGEFDTRTTGGTEALALAVPTNAISEPPPVELRLLSTSAWGILENARLDDWDAARPTLARMKSLWTQLQTKHYPFRVVATMDQAITALSRGVTKNNEAATSQAAIDVAQAVLDLELLHRRNVEADRFHLHAQQLRVFATRRDLAGVAGEVAVLEWIRERLANALSDPQVVDLDRGLVALRAASTAGNAPAAADTAARTAAQLRRP